MVATLGHADRAQPARWYLRGLMLPGARKSVEPMAARVHPQNVRSAHQAMHHLVADSEWSDQALLAAVAHQVAPALTAGQAPCYWIIDDTGFRKYGKHSADLHAVLGHQLVNRVGVLFLPLRAPRHDGVFGGRLDPLLLVASRISNAGTTCPAASASTLSVPPESLSTRSAKYLKLSCSVRLAGQVDCIFLRCAWPGPAPMRCWTGWQQSRVRQRVRQRQGLWISSRA